MTSREIWDKYGGMKTTIMRKGISTQHLVLNIQT